MLDAAGATHVSQSLRHWGALFSPWPDVADEMIHPSFTDITDHLVWRSLTAQYQPYAWRERQNSFHFISNCTVVSQVRFLEPLDKCQSFYVNHNIKLKPPGSMLKEDLH